MDLKKEAKEHVQQFSENFAFEFEKALMAINVLQHDAYEISKNSKYERNRVLSLNLCNDLLQFKVELFTSADVVDKASNFIEVRKKKIKDMMENEDEELNKAILTSSEDLPPNVDAPTTDAPEPDDEYVPDETQEHEIIPTH